MNTRSCIYVAGSETFLGKALVKTLRLAGYVNLVGLETHRPDLSDVRDVDAFFKAVRPEYVFLAAGRSGGILANRQSPADFMLDNLLTTAHVIRAAHRENTRKLLFLASACAYPKLATQPMRVESLLTGPLEKTSEPYALAKLAGWKLCDAYCRQYGANFITVFPANVFGPEDDFDPESGHIIAGLMRRMYAASVRRDPTVAIWGTGKPRREFIFSRDLASACIFLMQHYNGPEPINAGSGCELSIAEVAREIADVVGYEGALFFDTSKPDGMPLKSLDSSKLLALGWRPRGDFRSALEETFAWFREQHDLEDTDHVRALV
jgi:GDP-L-fucose synthase